MKTAIFKIAGNYRLIPLVPAFYFFIMLGFGNSLRKHKDSNIDIAFYGLLISFALISIYMVVAASRIRLIVNEEGIELKNMPFNIGGWKLHWNEVNEALFVYATLGNHHILLKNENKTRIVQLRQWEVDSSNLSLAEKKQPFFSFSVLSKKPPEDYALHQAIQLCTKLREATTREASEAINKQLDLGEKAGHVSIAAVIMMLIAIAVSYFNDSRLIVSGWINPLAVVISAIMAIFAYRYLKDGPNLAANIFICALLLGTSIAAVRSILLVSTLHLGTPSAVHFHLATHDNDYQIWESKDKSLSFEIYTAPDNFIYSALNTETITQVRRGALQNTFVAYSELEKFVKDPTKKRRKKSGESTQRK